MFEKLQTGKKSMMHQDGLKPAAIQFTLEHLQEPARRSGYFLLAFFMYLYPQEPYRNDFGGGGGAVFNQSIFVPCFSLNW